MYAYLVSWILGGIALLAMQLLRSARRPYGTALASTGFGAGGFCTVAFGLGDAQAATLVALGVGLAAGALGFGLGRLRVQARPVERGVELELPLR